MQLSTYFQTYVYHRTSASAVKAAEYLLRDALFPHGVLANAPDFEQFGVSERGHIFYRNHTLMKLADVASTPQTEQEACVKFEEFRAAVTQKLVKLYENDVKNNSLPKSAIADFQTLFQYLVFRYAEKICDTQSGELKYWQLHYALELPALKELRPKTDIDKGIVPSNTPSLARQLYEKYKKGVLQGESLSVGIGACGYVVNLDCNYLPISRVEAVALLDVNREKKELGGEHIFYQGYNYAVPIYAGGKPASKEGLSNTPKVILLISNNRIFVHENLVEKYSTIWLDMQKVIPYIPICKIIWDLYSFSDIYATSHIKTFVAKKTTEEYVHFDESGNRVDPNKMMSVQGTVLGQWVTTTQDIIQENIVFGRDIYVNFQDYVTSKK